MKFIYGPVKSRRLGLSLGLSLTPYKVCSFDCVYCQVGKTTTSTTKRSEYLLVSEITGELKSWIKNNPKQAKELEYVTFSGVGEPTLHLKIGELISEIKKLTKVKVAVITNASLLEDPDVRQGLLGADLLVPSLDAVTTEVFQAIDRPAGEIKIENIIAGLIKLRQEFKGQFWLEVMLVKGINDSPDEIRKLKEAIDRIKPDKIQLNSPVRPPAEPDVFPVDKAKLEEIKKIFGDKCEIV